MKYYIRGAFSLFCIFALAVSSMWGLSLIV